MPTTHDEAKQAAERIISEVDYINLDNTPTTAEEIILVATYAIEATAREARLFEVSSRLVALVWELDHGDQIEPGRISRAIEDWQTLSRPAALAPATASGENVVRDGATRYWAISASGMLQSLPNDQVVPIGWRLATADEVFDSAAPASGEEDGR